MMQRSSKVAPENAKGDLFSVEKAQNLQQTAAIAISSEPAPGPVTMPSPQAEDPELRRPIRWWGTRGLRFKVMTLAVTLATLPVMGVGGAAYHFANQTFTQRLVAESEEYSLSVQNKINLFLRQRLGDIQVMSQLSIFADPRQRADADQTQKQAALDRFVEAYEVYDNIAVTDLKGNVIAQSIGEKLPNLSNRTYFQEALKADQPIISQPEAGTLTKVLSIYIVAPIRDSVTNKTIGLIQARIPGDYFRMGVLSQEVQQRNTKIYLVDGNGKLFVTPEGVGAAALDAKGLPVTNEKGELQALDARSLFPNYQELQSKNTTTVDFSADELLTFTPIEDLRGLPALQWKLLIAGDKAAAFAAQNQLLLTLQVGTGLAILIAGAIAALIANRTIIPILAATNAVTKIGQGDLDTRLDIAGKDEIAILGININRMATQLQQSLKARAFEAAQERILTAAKGSGAVREVELQAIFDQTVEAVRNLLNLDRAVIYQFGADTDRVVAEAVKPEWPSAMQQQMSDACIPEQLRNAYLQGRVAVLHNGPEAKVDPEHSQLLSRLQVRSCLVVPVAGGDRLFGLLIAHSCAARREWQPVEIDFFKRLGTELGLSSYRVTLLTETETLAEEQRRLKEQLQARALELLQEVSPIGEGDLTVRAKVTVDEIGTIADSYNATVDRLRTLVLQVKDAVNQVVGTTQVTETSVQTLSAAAAQQLAESSLALERVEEVVGAVRDVTTNAKQAEQVIQQAAQTVAAGDAVIAQIVAGNQIIRDTVVETEQKVEHLLESSEKISTIVDLISSFAAQTHMLAGKVSIEAARSGGEGRTIMNVIAEEVRALVQRSEDATKEIRSLVSSIQAETKEVVVAMETSTEQVARGTQLIDATRQRLSEITDASLQINQLVQAITQATVVQYQASETIAQTMTDIAAIAQKTSTDTKQVSSSVEQLHKVAQLLQDGVNQFKVS